MTDDNAQAPDNFDINKLIDSAEEAVKVPKGAFGAIVKGDDWSLIIKAHALIEGAVSQMLADVLDERLRPILGRLELGREDTGKLAFTKALDLLTKEERRFIRLLSELRNALAHDIKHLNFNLKEHIESLKDKQQRASFTDAVLMKVTPESRDGWIDLLNKVPQVMIARGVLRIMMTAAYTIQKLELDKKQLALQLNYIKILEDTASSLEST